MNGKNKSRLTRIGAGVALGLGLGVASLVPVSPAQPGEPAEADTFVHIDGARRISTGCVPGTGTDNSPRKEGWGLPAEGLVYYVDIASIPAYLNQSQVIDAVKQAAGAWTAAGSAPLTYGGTIRWAGTIGDGRSTVSFGIPRLPDVASAATVKINKGVVAEADIVLDITNAWSTNAGASGDCGGALGKWDVQNALAHEFGHVVGAKHPPVNGNKGPANNQRTMYPELSAGELQKRSLSEGDIASIPSPKESHGKNPLSGIVDRGGDDDG